MAARAAPYQSDDIWAVDYHKKIIKIVATICQILRLKCTKNYFDSGSTPDPAGAYSTASDPLAGINGTYF